MSSEVGHCELTEQESAEPSPAWYRWIYQKPESQEKRREACSQITEENKWISEMVQIERELIILKCV